MVEVAPGTRVRVHYNLHRGDWVIGNPITGKVIRYADDVTLTEVRFVVSQAGHARSQRLGKRTVHAHCVGILVAYNTGKVPKGGTHVTYNPNREPQFTTDRGQPVTVAQLAVFHNAHVTAKRVA